MDRDISIYGAGLAGMAAGINLARNGFKVVSYEGEEGIGGARDLHPSIHTTPLQAQKTWEYIGKGCPKEFPGCQAL